MINATIQFIGILLSIALGGSGVSLAVRTADQILERICRFKSVLPAAYFVLAHVKEKLGDRPAASIQYRKYLAIRPADTSALFSLAVIELDSGNLDKSRQLLSLAKKTSNNYAIESNLGKVAEEKGQLTKALAHYKRACAFQDVSAEVFAHYGYLLYTLGKINEAEKAFAAALERDKKNYIANVGVANVALQKRDLKKAEIYFKRSLQLDPNDPGVAEGLRAVGELQMPHPHSNN